MDADAIVDYIVQQVDFTKITDRFNAVGWSLLMPSSTKYKLHLDRLIQVLVQHPVSLNVYIQSGHMRATLDSDRLLTVIFYAPIAVYGNGNDTIRSKIDVSGWMTEMIMDIANGSNYEYYRTFEVDGISYFLTHYKDPDVHITLAEILHTVTVHV